jgi:hypothetical protein
MRAIHEGLFTIRSIIEGNLNGGLRPVVVLKEVELYQPGEKLESTRPFIIFFDLLRENAERYGCEAVDRQKVTPNKKFDGVSTNFYEFVHAVEIKRGRHFQTADFLNGLGCIGVGVKDSLGRKYSRDAQPNTTGDKFAELLIAARDSIEAEYQRRISLKLR